MSRSLGLRTEGLGVSDLGFGVQGCFEALAGSY